MIYQKLIEVLINTGSVRATKYVSPKEIIRATRKRYKGKFDRKKIEVTFTIGSPNYIERKFIKNCIKAGELFPIKKIQLKYLKIKK